MRSDRCRYITAPIRISSSVYILCLLPGSINTWLGFAVSECGGSFLIKVSESWKSPWKVRVATLLRSFKLVSTLNEISWPSASWLSGDPRMESFKCHYASWKCHLSSSGLKTSRRFAASLMLQSSPSKPPMVLKYIVVGINPVHCMTDMFPLAWKAVPHIRLHLCWQVFVQFPFISPTVRPARSVWFYFHANRLTFLLSVIMSFVGPGWSHGKTKFKAVTGCDHRIGWFFQQLLISDCCSLAMSIYSARLI